MRLFINNLELLLGRKMMDNLDGSYMFDYEIFEDDADFHNKLRSNFGVSLGLASQRGEIFNKIYDMSFEPDTPYSILIGRLVAEIEKMNEEYKKLEKADWASSVTNRK